MASKTTLKSLLNKFECVWTSLNGSEEDARFPSLNNFRYLLENASLNLSKCFRLCSAAFPGAKTKKF